MLGWLKRAFRKPKGGRDLGGGYFENTAQKCPHCDAWSTTEKPHTWAQSPDSSKLVMTCYNGHVSEWFDTGFMGLLVLAEDSKNG